MQRAQPNLFTRGDTFFGICQGIGEDIGFNPDFLRLAFTALLFLNPVAALAAYAAMGAAVLASRLLFPNRSPAAAQPAGGLQPAAEDLAEPEPVPLAA